MKKITYVLVILSAVFAACENGDWEFPDYEYQAVYFANQSPVRTITLGDDIFDTSLDNEWKFNILATTGGVYTNEQNVNIEVAVSNELCDGLIFGGTGNDILPLPSNYYSLSSDQIVIPEGELVGGVEVQLTEDFFADPLSISNNYVIPLVMTSVSNADSILSGTPIADSPRRVVAEDWAVRPKDYVLYAVKFINPWHGFYLRRGVDNVTKDGETTTEVRHEEFVEYDQVKELTTLAYREVSFPLDYWNKEGQNLNMEVKLVFDENNECTVAPINTSYQVNDTVRVYNITATGSGQFQQDGEENSWGGQDRDALYLDYEVGYEVEINYQSQGILDVEEVLYSTVDTLVMRNRGVTFEEFGAVLE